MFAAFKTLLTTKSATSGPTLDFNPASGVFASITGPTPAFSRASGGTYIDAAGIVQLAALNVPRITYDPITHECLGYLAEEQRTNIVWPSLPQAQHAQYLANGITMVAGGSDGPLPYNRFSCSIATGYLVALAATTGAETGSILLRKVAGAQTHARIGGAIGGVATFLGNGEWIRVVAPTYNGDGWWGIYTNWGSDLVLDIAYFQIEAGAFPTSYIPTTTAAATRSADLCEISGADFLSFYNQPEGTVVVYATIPVITPYKYIYQFYGTGEISLRVEFTNTLGSYHSSLPSMLYDTVTNRTRHALAYGADFATSVNGAAAQSMPIGPAVAPTALHIGKPTYPQNMINGPIARLQYFPTRLPDDQLIELTQP